MRRAKTVTAVFYRTSAGDEPVRSWLKGRSLDHEDRRVIGTDIQVVEYEWPMLSDRNLVKAFGNGLLEVRSTLPSRRIARIIFGIAESQMVILHGFIKKTQKTPAADLDLAKARWRDWKKGRP